MDIPSWLQDDFDSMMRSVAWQRVEPPAGPESRDEDIPYETHRGTVHLGDTLPDIEVVQLNDGRRLITEDSMYAILKALGFLPPEED